jgi:hypothetical protein
MRPQDPVATVYDVFWFSEELVCAVYTIKNSKSSKLGSHDNNSSSSMIFWNTITNINLLKADATMIQ